MQDWVKDDCTNPPLHNRGFAGKITESPHFVAHPLPCSNLRGFAGEITAALVLDSLNDGAVLVDICTEVRGQEVWEGAGIHEQRGVRLVGTFTEARCGRK